MSAERSHAWRRPAGARPWVLGHRGARRSAPENTLRAFDLAHREGADGVELDVRLSADGVVMVAHDRGLQRVTQGRDERRVATLSAAELGRVDLGDGATLPTLAEVLVWARQTRLRVNVELKQDVPARLELCRAVAALLRQEHAAPERLLLSSFDPLMVLTMSRLLPDVPRGWLVHADQRWLRSAPGHSLLGADAIHAEHALLVPARVDRWRRAGLLVNTWTVNSPAEVQRVTALGVDCIITDTPARTLAALRVA